MSQKNIILFINSVSKGVAESIKEYGQKTGKTYRLAVIRDKKKKGIDTSIRPGLHASRVFSCNLQKASSIKKYLKQIQHEVVAIVSRGESNIDTFKKVIPHVPYVVAPTITSLEWATDKVRMRNQLQAYNKDICPKFTIINDTSEESIILIKKKVGFPLVIKPAGLAASLLVSLCFHEEELEKTLKKVFKKIKNVYKENNRVEQPKILVEQFMEGEMYSIDAYIDQDGKIYWCPLVHVKTGKSIGFDDFFGYQRIVPTTLRESTQDKARLVAQDSIHALGLRAVTAHIELMRTENGWKVIELGARIGGFRHKLYDLSFGIDHSLNDVLIRMNKKPNIPKKKKGYAVALQFYPRKEGTLITFKGTKSIKKLSSFEEVKTYKKIGDSCLFAKHGGKSICDVILFNKDRSELLADIHRVEQKIIIETKKGK